MTTPVPNLQDLNQDDLEGMDMAQLEALARGGAESPPVPEALPAPEAAPIPEAAPGALPMPVTPDPAAAAAAIPDPSQRQGDPEVPLRAAREAARQAQERAQELEQRQQQIEAFLNDPRAVQKYLHSIAPEARPDFDDDPDAALEARLAPLALELNQVKAQLAHTQAEAAHAKLMNDMVAKHGPDFHHVLAAFDAEQPNLAQVYHPEMRYLAALGLKGKSAPAPETIGPDDPRVLAAAQKLLAEKLAGGAPLRGVPTLGAAPTARETTPAPDLDRMGQADQERMSFAELQALAKKAYGGG